MEGLFHFGPVCARQGRAVEVGQWVGEAGWMLGGGGVILSEQLTFIDSQIGEKAHKKTAL